MNAKEKTLAVSFLERNDCWVGYSHPQQRGDIFQLLCPTCGFNCCHLGKPVYDNENVTVPIEGECGHNWALFLQFHKGEVALFAIELQAGGQDMDEQEQPAAPEQPNIP